MQKPSDPDALYRAFDRNYVTVTRNRTQGDELPWEVRVQPGNWYYFPTFIGAIAFAFSQIEE